MNIFKNLKIKDKLMVSFSINVLFMIIIGIISYMSVSKMQDKLEDIFLTRLPAIDFLLEADRDLHQSLIAHRTMIFTKPESKVFDTLIDDYDSNKEQTLTRFGKYVDLASSSTERALAPKFFEAYDDWENAANEVVVLVRSEDPTSLQTAMNRSTGDVKEKFDFMRGFIDQATEINMNDAKQAHVDAMNVYKSTLHFIITVVLISIAVAVFLALSVSKSITRPLGHAVSGLKEVAQGEGDLTRRLMSEGKDEVGELTHWFNRFMENLQSLIKKIMENTESTAEAAHMLLDLASKTTNDASNLAARSNSVSSSSEELSRSINEVAASVEEYSTSINVVATAAEEMNASVMEISRNTTRANDMTNDSVDEARITSEKMKILNEAAQEITKVTEVIHAISAQTNLLALNATIEAASAGEAGKGFAVVAHEIKELARQTSGATNEIQTQIENIQGSCQGAIEQIEKITEIIGEVDSVVSSIAAAVEEQSVTTTEISGNITQASDSINDVSRSVANGSESSNQIAQDVGEVDKLVVDINVMSRNLDDGANKLQASSAELRDLVSRFKVA